jgi:hypothetical protein
VARPLADEVQREQAQVAVGEQAAARRSLAAFAVVAVAMMAVFVRRMLVSAAPASFAAMRATAPMGVAGVMAMGMVTRHVQTFDITK